MVVAYLVGGAVFWIGLIAAIIIYANFRKFNHLMYLVSICLYVFTVGYVIDAFSLGKNAILLLLAFSSILMMGLGYYFMKKFSRQSFAPARKK
jgi:hypothetical protein